MSGTENNRTAESIGPERDRERPGTSHPAFLAEDAHRVLSGYPVGGQLGVNCDGCDARLRNRDEVTVTLDRDDAGWTAPVLFCGGCETTETTDLDSVNVAASARLATVNSPSSRRNHLCLTGVCISTFSPFGEGGA